MIRNREEAVQRALTARTYPAGACQKWTRELYGAPSAGDRDGDKDADAVDGWRSEPETAKRSGRDVPRGYPAAFVGGSRGFGHRCISLGNGKFRSTDMDGPNYKAGVVGTCTLADIEREMGVRYVGWSTTITGIPIPDPPKPKPTFSRGGRIDHAIRDLEKSKGEGRRARQLKLALAKLRAIKPFKVNKKQ